MTANIISLVVENHKVIESPYILKDAKARYKDGTWTIKGTDFLGEESTMKSKILENDSGDFWVFKPDESAYHEALKIANC